MPESTKPKYFAERIFNIAHANGVFRITLGVNEDRDTVIPVLDLLIPANQLGAIIQGIAKGAKEINEQINQNEINQISEEENQSADKKISTRKKRNNTASRSKRQTAAQ